MRREALGLLQGLAPHAARFPTSAFTDGDSTGGVFGEARSFFHILRFVGRGTQDVVWVSQNLQVQHGLGGAVPRVLHRAWGPSTARPLRAYPASLMGRFQHHVFVCLNERDPSDARGCCHARGGAEVLSWFKEEMLARGLKGKVRMNKAGCLDACDFGPAVVVYPSGTWYTPQNRDDVRAIVERHLVGGERVGELLVPGM